MIKSDGSLYIPTEWIGRNPHNGRFLKGHQPSYKGKKWDEIMDKETQERCKKGWENLDKHRPAKRSDTAGRCRKTVVAVRNNGKYIIFDYMKAAADWIQGRRENVGRCCRDNQARHTNLKTGRVNTDHQYKGVRFCFAEDPVWQEKIGKDIV